MTANMEQCPADNVREYLKELAAGSIVSVKEIAKDIGEREGPVSGEVSRLKNSGALNITRVPGVFETTSAMQHIVLTGHSRHVEHVKVSRAKTADPDFYVLESNVQERPRVLDVLDSMAKGDSFRYPKADQGRVRAAITSYKKSDPELAFKVRSFSDGTLRCWRIA